MKANTTSILDQYSFLLTCKEEMLRTDAFPDTVVHEDIRVLMLEAYNRCVAKTSTQLLTRHAVTDYKQSDRSPAAFVRLQRRLSKLETHAIDKERLRLQTGTTELTLHGEQVHFTTGHDTVKFDINSMDQHEFDFHVDNWYASHRNQDDGEIAWFKMRNAVKPISMWKPNHYKPGINPLVRLFGDERFLTDGTLYPTLLKQFMIHGLSRVDTQVYTVLLLPDHYVTVQGIDDFNSSYVVKHYYQDELDEVYTADAGNMDEIKQLVIDLLMLLVDYFYVDYEVTREQLSKFVEAL